MCTSKENNSYLTKKIIQLCGYFSLLLLALSFSGMATAQTVDSTQNSIVNQQIWFDFYPHYYRSEKLEYYGDAGYRTIVSNRSWSRIYARPSLKYHLNKNWELHSGLGVFYISNSDAIDQFEITPWQGVLLKWPEFRRISFKHLVKLEERWSFFTDTWNSNFEFRFRYKLSGTIDLNNKWSIPFYGEAFLPLTGKIEELYQNQGRAGVGLSYNASEDWKIAFLMNWQRSKAGQNAEVGVSDYIYQLKIVKKWKRLIGKQL